MGKVCTHNRRNQEAFKILTGKSIGKRPLGRPKRSWEKNIREELK